MTYGYVLLNDFVGKILLTKCKLFVIIKSAKLFGGMTERTKVAVLKTVVALRYQGFESLTHRHDEYWRGGRVWSIVAAC